MEKVTFVVSHLGSGSFELLNILNKNPRCDIFSSNIRYEHPDDIEWMFKSEKLRRNSGCVYGDHLLFNTSFYCKNLYNYCKFIYLVSSPRQTLNNILSYNIFQTPQNIINYYSFRLRRIYEMAKNTKGAILLYRDDLLKPQSLSIIENYLELTEPLKKIDNLKSSDNNFKESLILDTERCYEKYYYYLKNLELRRCDV